MRRYIYACTKCERSAYVPCFCHCAGMNLRVFQAPITTPPVAVYEPTTQPTTDGGCMLVRCDTCSAVKAETAERLEAFTPTGGPPRMWLTCGTCQRSRYHYPFTLAHA